MKRILKLLGLLVVGLAGVLVTRALRVGSPPPPPPPVALEVDASEVAESLAGAVRIQTVSFDESGPSAESLAALHAYLSARYPRAFATLEREEFPGGTFTLTWRGRDSSLAPVLLLAHQDVVPVPAETEGEWAHPPFSGAVAGGFVWGRGALDDKASLIDLLSAVELLLGQGFVPQRTVVLSFGHDEEVGGEGQKQVAAAFAERGIRPAMVLDEGLAITRGAAPGVERPVALIGVAEKGSVSFELSVDAEGGHSSMPRRETAISILSNALARLTREPLPARSDSLAYTMIDALAPAMSFPARLMVANRWLFSPLLERQMSRTPSSDAMLRTTLAPTILQAGVKENVLPPRARAVINLRIVPGDTVDGVEALLRQRIADPRIELRRLSGIAFEPTPVSSPDGWGYRVLSRSVREALPDAVVAPGLMVGASDSRHYLKLSDQIFRFQPVVLVVDDFARFHGLDERIATSNLELAVRIYARLLENAAGGAEPPTSAEARRIDSAEPQT